MDYKAVMNLVVCGLSNICMVHRCSNCPGKANLVSKVQILECLMQSHFQWKS